MTTRAITDDIKKLCTRFYEDTEIDLGYVVNNDMQEDIDSLIEYLEERANEIECIYFSNAIEYLAENDASLQDSLAIAHDMGCTLETLNSETLATLLMQQNAREKIYEYKDELEEVLYPEDK